MDYVLGVLDRCLVHSPSVKHCTGRLSNSPGARRVTGGARENKLHVLSPDLQ